jgi:hypothetical protein
LSAFFGKWNPTATMTLEINISKAMGENVNSQLISRRMTNRTRRNSQKEWPRMNSPKGRTSREIILRFIGQIICDMGKWAEKESK